MERRDINPWTWQDAFGFSQAIEVRGAQRVLYCAGQTSVDAEANPLHAGDMAAQMQQALDNLEAVLAALPQLGARLQAAQCKPSSTLLGVAGLFHPDILVEFEATAVS